MILDLGCAHIYIYAGYLAHTLVQDILGGYAFVAHGLCSMLQAAGREDLHLINDTLIIPCAQDELATKQ